jgi:hypothetical protein
MLVIGTPRSEYRLRAQNLILQAIQRHLEFDAFQFVHKWLLEESLMVGTPRSEYRPWRTVVRGRRLVGVFLNL